MISFWGESLVNMGRGTPVTSGPMVNQKNKCDCFVLFMLASTSCYTVLVNLIDLTSGITP